MEIVERSIAKPEDSDLLRFVDVITTTRMVKVIDNAVRTVENFPTAGVKFRDLTTVWKDTEAFRASASALHLLLQKDSVKIDKIVGLEARGFVYAALLADRLNKPFVPARKGGKLPAASVYSEYNTEYNKQEIGIHLDAITPGERIVIVDDLIATGGSVLATIECIKQLQGEILMVVALADLTDLNGKDILRQAGYETYTVLSY